MSDNRFIQSIRYILRKVKAFLFSKDALSFLFFLLLSFVFWFVNAVNKDRDANITIPVRYVEMPKDAAIVNDPPLEIKLNVRDEGLNLFSYSKKRLTPLNVDMSQAKAEKGYIKIPADQLHIRFSYLLRPTTSIISIVPDSIVVQYEKLKSVKLPVKFDSDIELAQQYIFSDSIRIEPTEVIAYGKKEALDTLREVRTEHIVLKKLKDSVSLQAKLLPISSVNLSADEIKIDIPVEMFTEKNIQLPVEFINSPERYVIKSFPAFVNVTYNIGISHYNTRHDDVRIVIDYNDIKGKLDEKQKVLVVTDSPKIFNIRVSPEEVELILEEQPQSSSR